MARLKNIIHSDDSCMMVFKGDINNPEPSTGVIKFPGGYVEVSRCSDGTYWAHLAADDSVNIVGSRIDYNHEGWIDNGIPNILDQDKVKRLAIRIDGPFLPYQ